MKTSLYDEIVWLLEHVADYGDKAAGFLKGDAAEWLEDFDERVAEVLRLLKNEPKKEA